MNCQIYRIEKVGKCLSIILQIKKGQNGKKTKLPYFTSAHVISSTEMGTLPIR